MHLHQDVLRLSATDLAKHLACHHLTELDRAVAERRLDPPDWHDPALALLQERGLAHETAYVQHLRAQGLNVVDLRDVEGADAVARTRAAMAEGVEVIVQADLRDGRWGGRADVLLRVPEPSELGSWSYEPLDTKLAIETRGGTILQLCLYADLVGRVQGRPPERMHVVKPGEGFPMDTFRFAEFEAYYRLVSRRLEKAVSGAPATNYPEPVPMCETCRWSRRCDSRRRSDDHLSFVAGLRSLHIDEIKRQGAATLTHFAEQETPLRERPQRGHIEAFAKGHEQARIQLRGRNEGRPIHTLLPIQPGLGLNLLPEPSPGDLFFDIESDPFVAGGGLEYLLGLAFVGEGGHAEYRAWWALDRGTERRTFEEFIDFVMDRWARFPRAYIYHFSPYEPAAIKRLMSRHGTREAQVDRLLRAMRFIDLFAVVGQGIRASVESYSLKELERFYGFRRQADLRDAAAALRRVASALELSVPAEITEADRATVETYNKEDCLSTSALRHWLEAARAEAALTSTDLVRPEERDGNASDAIAERAEEVQAVFDRLVTGLPEDRAAWGPIERGRWLLAHQLEYFRREDRCAWWEFFRLHELDTEELLEERKAIAGIEFEREAGGTARCPIHRYRYPMQEVGLAVGDKLHEAGGDELGTVDRIDAVSRRLDIKKRGDAAGVHPSAVVVKEVVSPRPIDTSLLHVASSIAEHGLDGAGPYRATRDLLLKYRPRLRDESAGALRRQDEPVVEAAVRLARDLNLGMLPIQGPPGSGKTYAGARMILALARSGSRIGVTAVSHKVIRHLLEEVLTAAAEDGVSLRLVHKVSEAGTGVPPGIEETTANDRALAAVQHGLVVGGTAWLWARPEMDQTLDYLFVDEAGQMSLAQVIGASRAARNLVLLGDPQQLEQPQRGAHPEGAEVAALVHALDGHATIPDDRGLFLDVTWRLHPRICTFTSELFYEGRLQARPSLDGQAIHGDTPFAGSGLFYVPVEHTGNQSVAPDEVDSVAAIVAALVRDGVTWTDSKGVDRPLRASDVLIVAPYNAQVAALTERLPGVRVGTVDKFQGQEAPAVIYSMTSSSAEDAPRGMSFLYSPNRLNVATSRAKCICILVGTTRLMEPECRTPEQMRWANSLCRFRELAREVVLP
jgi:predicted RecB family nuclease